MATYTRNNAWDNGGTFDNPDLWWYAKGVAAMMARPLNDPRSWWFFAAIHGAELAHEEYPGWAAIPGPPTVPIAPLPSPDHQALYWNQCQHGTWFFPPWHRGYLLALEAQIRACVASLGGPATWALPYWNYFGGETQNEIPPAFTQAKLPDGITLNPLFVIARYGPNADGHVYVPINQEPYYISQACLSNPHYTGRNPTEFGGPDNGFQHISRDAGSLEANPHNFVHGLVGGRGKGIPSWSNRGVMGDPDTAALDPIFYLHHANIDRMWAIWNLKHPNPAETDWLNGPAELGESKFVMPMPPGSSWGNPWHYSPEDVKSTEQLDYTYAELAAPAPDLLLASALTHRLARLAPAAATANLLATPAMKTEKLSELMGAHDGALQLTNAGAQATVRISSPVHGKFTNSLLSASVARPPDHKR